ncbi:MAG: Sip1-related alpha-galactosidase [Planctomycetota bacterium]
MTDLAVGRAPAGWAMFVVLACVLLSSAALAGDKHQPNPKVTGTMDFSALSGAGAKILEGYSGKPDGSKWGVLATWELALPAFSRGLFFTHAGKFGWPNMMNRGYPFAFNNNKGNIKNLHDGGIFFILPVKGGGNLAVTAMAGAKTQSWFHTDEKGRILLSFGTFGTAEVKCDAPLFAWAKSDDVYEACYKAFVTAITSKPLEGRTHLRHKKPYREYFKYLGWCSWEHFKGNINETNMLEAITAIERSRVPVRYVLIDMGHGSQGRGGMTSFKPSPKKFPNGWQPLLRRRKKDKIKWMCLWRDFRGSGGKISAHNDFGEEVNKHLQKLTKDTVTIRNDPDAALAFYRAYMGTVKKWGFDFVKTDFQSAQLSQLSGKVKNGAEMCAGNSQGFQKSLEELDLGLINCNWHNPVNFFNSRTSNVGRLSIDYSKNSLFSAKRHLFQSYGNALWLCQNVWGDHDMFHSSHEGVGRIMAISKAMSGAPVYLSDNPTDFVPEYITPLCYRDGELLRPIAPAAPLPDSIFVDPLRQAVPYRVVAPLPGGSVSVVAYNLYHGKGGKVPANIKMKVTPDDYARASAMVQPYPGAWKLPGEGLAYYDWHTGKGGKLAKEYAFELKGFIDRLVHLCPVKKGWAVIGRTDKYLSPVAVEVLSAGPSELKLRMVESGPLAVWSQRGVPRAKGLTFKDAGDGLYKADLPVGKRGRTITIRR